MGSQHTLAGARALAVGGAFAAGGVMLLGGLLAVLSGDQPWLMPALAPVVVVPAAVGTLIVLRRPGNAIGWVLLADAVVLAVDFAVQPYARYAILTSPGSLPAGRWALLWDAADWPTLFAGVAALALVFPDGRRLPGRRWGWVAALGVISFAGMLVSGLLDPDPFAAEYGDIASPLPRVGAAALVGAPLAIGILVVLVAAAWAVRLRLRRATGLDRLRLLWFAYGAVLVPLAVVACLAEAAVTGGVGPISLAAAVIAATALPLATGIALFRHQLFDIELALNRTLVYGTLTLLVLSLSVALVAGLSVFLNGRGLTGALAAASAALAAQPLHRWLQRRVDRLMYGDRSDPYAALSSLGHRLESAPAGEEVLDTIVGSVARALRLAHAVIELDHDGHLVRAASVGRSHDEDPSWFPLTYHGEPLGRLGVVPPRGESLAAPDRRLLADLARQSGVAVHGVRLTADLQRSRERLVAAREEERRRVRRDLHDGLGPSLAGMVLKLGAARAAAAESSGDTERLLAELTIETQESIAEIRRLVDGLRPPALDDLGLLQALRSQGARLDETSSPRFRVSGPDALPELPAAVEVAAYRIASEALTNAARHARATRCDLRIAMNGGLELEVEDDGTGIVGRNGRGIGLRSMHDRADELGGVVTVGSGRAGGTLVRVTLPISPP